MREIKFRAWDKKNKVMMEQSDEFDFDFGEGMCVVISESYISDEKLRKLYFEKLNYSQGGIIGYCYCDDKTLVNLELMQYIGLKDDYGQGKELYHYDIVMYKKFKYIIEWDEINGRWYGRQPRKPDGNELDGAYTGVLVAGNL